MITKRDLDKMQTMAIAEVHYRMKQFMRMYSDEQVEMEEDYGEVVRGLEPTGVQRGTQTPEAS